MSRVIIVPCSSYDEEKVYTALKTGINELGGLEKYIKKDEKILVKPNFLAISDSKKPITTHKSVISGFLKILNENGYLNVKCGDSPAMAKGQAVADSIGLIKEDLCGAAFAEMNEEITVKNPNGKIAKELSLCREAAEADAIIGLCKMKTHAFMGITGAVKNMYGLVCGRKKSLWHVKYNNPSKFAKMLADIHICVKPRFHIMDAIVAMEGNGPASGEPVDMGLLLFSEDPVAIDTVFCYLTGINEKSIMTNIQGAKAGIGTFNENEIEILVVEETADSFDAIDRTANRFSRQQLFEKYGKPDFKAETDEKKLGIASRLLQFEKKYSRKPCIDESKCIRCGRCVAACPVDGGAVHFSTVSSVLNESRRGEAKAEVKNTNVPNEPETEKIEQGNTEKNKTQKTVQSPPVYDYKKCIRCYCCQEVCPEKAIYVRH